MKYTKTTVKRIAGMVAEFTGGAVRMAEVTYLGNGPCYIDGHNPDLRWDTCTSKTAGREAVSYYAAAACQWATLHQLDAPRPLREAHDELRSRWQPPAVQAASKRGVAAAEEARKRKHSTPRPQEGSHVTRFDKIRCPVCEEKRDVAVGGRFEPHTTPLGHDCAGSGTVPYVYFRKVADARRLPVLSEAHTATWVAYTADDTEIGRWADGAGTAWGRKYPICPYRDWRNHYVRGGEGQAPKPPKPKRDYLDMDKIAAAYLAGASTLDLAAEWGVHNATIGRRLADLGVIRSVKDASRLRLSRTVRHGSVQGLADELGVDLGTMNSLLIKHGFIGNDQAAGPSGQDPDHAGTAGEPTA
jgi:hypothetical protein